MAERSKALRSGRSPLLWAWVRIPLLTKPFCFGSVFKESRVAQWKRAGPITQRSVDRNYALLSVFCHGCIHGDATGGMISEVKFNGMAEPVLIGVKGDANYSVGQCQTLDTPRLLFFSHVKRENEKHMRPMRDSNPRPSD